MDTKKHYFCVPTVVELTNEKSWDELDKKGTKFFVMRLHFMMKVRDVEDEIKDGGVVTVIESPKHVSQERVVSIEIEKEYVDFDQTLVNCTLEEENLNEVLGELLSESTFPGFFKMRGRLKGKLTSLIRNRLEKTFEQGKAATFARKFTLTTTARFGDQFKDKAVQVKQYQKCSFDIYLAFIDYLQVDYKSSMLGFRKKRKKSPKLDHKRNYKRTNVLKINQALASIHFWKLHKDTSVFKSAKDYINQVPNPAEFIVNPPEDTHEYHVAISKDIPSLYQIANAAFPLKWVEREAGKSKEDLLNMEEDDYQVRWGLEKKKKRRKTSNSRNS